MYNSLAISRESRPCLADEENAVTPDVPGFNTQPSVSQNGRACQVSSDGEIMANELKAGMGSGG